MGNLYSRGLGVKADAEKAIHYYKLAAEKNKTMDLINLGNIYLDGKVVKQDINEAIKCYEQSASQGNSTAYMSLGNLYYLGKGVELDYKKIIYLKAAEMNDADGLNLFLIKYLARFLTEFDVLFLKMDAIVDH